MSELNIPESVLLLALADDSGEKRGNYLSYCLAGAALTELVLHGRLAELGEPPKRLSIVNPHHIGNAYVDACLDAMVAKGTDKEARAYIESIGAKSSLMQPLYRRLIERGILSEAKSKILFFTHTVYPEANPAPERRLRERLLKVITDTGSVDVRDAAILALAHHCEILRHNFDREVLKTHEKRIKAISEGGLLPPNAARAAIQGIQAAVMIATLVPIIAVASSS